MFVDWSLLLDDCFGLWLLVLLFDSDVLIKLESLAVQMSSPDDKSCQRRVCAVLTMLRTSFRQARMNHGLKPRNTIAIMTLSILLRFHDEGIQIFIC